MNYPKVSIMLPTYNAAAFIADCINSILDQEYPNIQIVVSDDASTDGTVAILKGFKSKFDSKILLNLNKENLGISKNCNLALNLCEGEYVCFFAGDDLMLPGKLKKQVECLESDIEAAFCYHSVEIFDSESNAVLEVTENNRTIFSFFDIIERGGLPGANSVMARKNAIPSSGYSEEIPSVSDWLFFIELGLRGKILFVDSVLARYRKHLGGCSNKADLLLDETLETLDLIGRRFDWNYKILKSCEIARKRYLLGTVARLIRAGDSAELARINASYIKSASVIIYMSVEIYRRFGFAKLGIGEYVFQFMKFVKDNVIKGKG